MLLKSIPVRTFVVEADQTQKEIMISCEAANNVMQLYPDEIYDIKDSSIFFYLKDELFDAPLSTDFLNQDFKILEEKPTNSKLLMFPKSVYKRKELQILQRLAGSPTLLGNWILELEYVVAYLDKKLPAQRMIGDLAEYSFLIPDLREDMRGNLNAGFSHLILTDEEAPALLARRKKLNLPADPARALMERLVEIEQRLYVEYKIGGHTVAVSAGEGDDVLPGPTITLHSEEDGSQLIRVNRMEYAHYQVLGKNHHLQTVVELIKNFEAHHYNIKKIMSNA